MELADVTLAGARVREAPECFARSISTSSWLTRPIGGSQKPVVSVYGDVHIVFYEEYFMRTKSQLLLVAVFEFSGTESCGVHVVSGGGKVGLFRVSLGAEESMASAAVATLREVSSELALEFQTQE